MWQVIYNGEDFIVMESDNITPRIAVGNDFIDMRNLAIKLNFAKLEWKEGK